MIIVVEGPDGAGKSTLCDAVEHECQRMNLRTVAVHSDGPGDFKEYMNVIAQGGDPSLMVIADRLHYGEMVYGTTRRQFPNFPLSDFLLLEEMLYRMNGKVCVLAPPYVTLLERIAERDEPLHSNLSLERTKFMFLAKLMQRQNPRTVYLCKEEALNVDGVARGLVASACEQRRPS